MLSPEYLSKVAEGSERIAEELHEYIIRQIVDRMMARMGRGEEYLLTASDKWRIQTLTDAGYLLEDITAELAKYTKKQRKEIKEAMEEAGVKALSYDHAIYEAAGLSPMPLWQSPTLIRLMERNMAATMGEWNNYTRTTAQAAQRLYISECDLAYHKVLSGAVSYTQAVREAVEAVVSDGVYVQYPSGHRDTIETATARAVRTGIAQAAGDISIKRMEEMDWDIILVSAHLGARTGDGGQNPGNHLWWQGQYYSRTGRDKRFPNFYEVTGYGTGVGLSGYNCRHSFGSGTGEPEDNPFRDIQTEDNYKTEQNEKRQRTMERRIRKTKREVMGLQEAVDQCKDEKLKFELQQDLDRKSYLLQKQNKAYKDFCKDNNLRMQSERLQIARWNREQAAKAIGAARRYGKRLENSTAQGIIKKRVETGEYNLQLSKQQYLKHVEGTKQYADYERTRVAAGKTPQNRLTITEKEAQEFIRSKYGTGTPNVTQRGVVRNIEFVSGDIVIGQYIKDNIWIDTKRAAIHYGAKSSHVIPVEEKDG